MNRYPRHEALAWSMFLALLASFTVWYASSVVYAMIHAPSHGAFAIFIGGPFVDGFVSVPLCFAFVLAAGAGFALARRWAPSSVVTGHAIAIGLTVAVGATLYALMFSSLSNRLDLDRVLRYGIILAATITIMGFCLARFGYWRRD